jgi:hypothetical protein
VPQDSLNASVNTNSKIGHHRLTVGRAAPWAVRVHQAPETHQRALWPRVLWAGPAVLGLRGPGPGLLFGLAGQAGFAE